MLLRVQAFLFSFKQHIPQYYYWVQCPVSRVLRVQYKSQSCNAYFAVTSGAVTYTYFHLYCIPTNISTSLTNLYTMKYYRFNSSLLEADRLHQLPLSRPPFQNHHFLHGAVWKIIYDRDTKSRDRTPPSSRRG